MPDALRVTAALLCEYVAPGHNGKHNLVNVYPGDVVVANWPAKLGLGFYLEIERQTDRPDDKIELDVMLNGELLAKIEATRSGGSGLRVGNLVIQHMELNIEEDSGLEIWVKAESMEPIRAISKKIYKSAEPA